MPRRSKILVQTTVPKLSDDWSVDSLTLLREHLDGLEEEGNRFEAVGRNREVPAGSSDPLLSRLDESDFDELWLFALDSGDGLTADDCEGISRFWRRGGGILTVRDHQNMGSSLCGVGDLGAAHHFQARNPERDPSRRVEDDRETANISWPNYHSGRNGDFQRITAVEPVHPLLRDPENPARVLEFFPSHPHEGAVSAPLEDASARVIARGRSTVSGRPFNLVVAFESRRDHDGNRLGRAAAHSSFHHFADYNWDTRKGAPSFVTEPEGTGMASNPRAAADIRAYVRNLALWLASAVRPPERS